MNKPTGRQDKNLRFFSFRRMQNLSQIKINMVLTDLEVGNSRSCVTLVLGIKLIIRQGIKCPYPLIHPTTGPNNASFHIKLKQNFSVYILEHITDRLPLKSSCPTNCSEWVPHRWIWCLWVILSASSHCAEARHSPSLSWAGSFPHHWGLYTHCIITSDAPPLTITEVSMLEFQGTLIVTSQLLVTPKQYVIKRQQ